MQRHELLRSEARTLCCCCCAGGMTAEQEHEDSRLVAIHRLVAVRRFAQGDAEPCQVLEGLFVGARAAPAPEAAHWPQGGRSAVRFLATLRFGTTCSRCLCWDWLSRRVLSTESTCVARLYCSAQRAGYLRLRTCRTAAALWLPCKLLLLSAPVARLESAHLRSMGRFGDTCTCLGRAAVHSAARLVCRKQGAAARSGGCLSTAAGPGDARKAPLRKSVPEQARSLQRATLPRALRQAPSARRGTWTRCARGASPTWSTPRLWCPASTGARSSFALLMQPLSEPQPAPRARGYDQRHPAHCPLPLARRLRRPSPMLAAELATRRRYLVRALADRRHASAGSRRDASARHRKRLRYKAVPVFDDAEEDIARFFHDTNRFIGKARRARRPRDGLAGAPHSVLRSCACTASRAREASEAAGVCQPSAAAARPPGRRAGARALRRVRAPLHADRRG